MIEWKKYRRFLAQHLKEKITTQLQELATDNMMEAMYPSLRALATICLTMPVTTASVERTFSQMKLIKSRYTSLSHLMKVAIESPKHLSDQDLEQIINV